MLASGALVSEWVGGCTNKCIKLVRVRREQKQEEHRIEEKERIEQERRDAEILGRTWSLDECPQRANIIDKRSPL